MDSNLAHNIGQSQSTSCRRCGSNDVFTEPAKPPHYLAARCRSCGLFAKFISKSDARRFQADKARLTVPPKTYPPTGVADTPQDVIARIEKLEQAFAGYDSQLAILVKAILACGVLQGSGSVPGVEVDDRDVNRLVEELAEGEAAR